jgi:hypothetical protein
MDWLLDRRRVPTRALAKLFERLRLLGHELRRPEGDFLRDGIYELRARHQSVNYRLLYFFHTHRSPATGRTAALAAIAVGLTKEDVVPPRLIALAARYRDRFAADPAGHTHEE